MSDDKPLCPGQIVRYRLPSYRLPTNPNQEWIGKILAVYRDCFPQVVRVKLLDGEAPGDEEYIPVDCVTAILSSSSQ
jgi:hypothetical protein